jgi:predicted TIM-barrel fold metal-dependent hydrolase
MIIPNSSGKWAPRLTAPPGACDSHIHIYDPRFPASLPANRLTRNATVADYRMLQKRLGTSRTVVVQPAAYGFDNAVTLDAIAQLGIANARAVAVIQPSITDAELREMDRLGVRGVRFTQHDPKTAVTTREMIEPVAARIADLGWHVQLHVRGDQLAEMAEMIARLPCTIVVDHLARIPPAQGINHPAFELAKRLLDSGRAWVKLSGAYLDSRSGPPGYIDVRAIARALIRYAPDRCVWGSDWPHPTETETKPDDAALLDLLAEWSTNDDTRQRILVENPAILYAF